MAGGDDHKCRDIAIGIGVAAAIYTTYRLTCKGSRPKAAPPEQDFVKDVVTSVTSSKGLRPDQTGDRGKIDRHKGFFIRRRTRLVGQANAALRNEPGLGTLKARIASDFDQVDHFIAGRIGTSTARGPLFGGKDDTLPPHLDLGELLHQRFDDPTTTLAQAVAATTPNEIQARALRALDERKMRVIGIVWRATALHDELWNPAPDGHTATLNEKEVSEILDRRLRSVERLQFTACGDVPTDAMGSSAIKRRFLPKGPDATATKGPWIDDHARTFELPSAPAELRSFLSSSLDTDVDHTRFVQDPSQLHWYPSPSAGESDWNDWPGTRVFDSPPPALPSWERLPPDPAGPGGRPGYGWSLTSVGDFTPAKIIDKMFSNRFTDWWLRSWLNSDGMLSAIHLEALLHARRRRDHNDNLFDGLRDKFDLVLDDHFGIRTVAGAQNSIMRSGRTDLFDNGPVPYDDLQIGDQLLVDKATSLLTLSVLSSTWDYPTVLVTDVDSDPNGDALIEMLNRIRIQGFMTADLTFGALQSLLARRLDASLEGPRRIIALNASAAASLPWPAGFEFMESALFATRQILRPWDPYSENWDAPGAWWIMIELADPIWRGLFAGTSATELVKKMPKAVTRDSTGILCQGIQGPIAVGAGFKEPPFTLGTGQIYIPLYEPWGGWPAYFKEKPAQTSEPWPKQLNPVRAEPSWFYLAEESVNAVRAIRPRNAPPSP
jgi:hypothetical protein